ncbi:N-acyl homoserine lactone synthase [Burkholderia singularis]|uniref:Acyl-homoserine-lactone synthase n=1 Tax=Burkholderia singularis TaxID=1503053 RepID=A0A124P7Z9_9BURK|nr:acyl-homoserine-lactone synthase [Burkholderia singularis]KVE23812.1 N-acyl homoserine lactone synthase [Burkholderia singularis]
MSSILAGRFAELPPHIRTDLGAYRYDVFVRRLGWTIAGHRKDDRTEWDRFDRPSTVHVVALDDARNICGCARLLPTTGPYLLRDAFPYLLGPARAPRSPTVWEISRFAASYRPGRSAVREPHGRNFLASVLAVADSLGATQVIGVMSPSIARLYRHWGLALQCLANATSATDGRILACAIDLQHRALNASSDIAHRAGSGLPAPLSATQGAH